MILSGCERQEQQAYDRLKPLWRGLPEAMRSYCDGIARFGGGGSYMLLDGCVRQEQSAGRDVEQFKFKR
jgi:hypothetical protein